jgi:hypothetical protein
MRAHEGSGGAATKYQVIGNQTDSHSGQVKLASGTKVYLRPILISNPPPGTSGYTSPRKAAEYIRRGRAEIVDGMLKFISRSEREQAEWKKEGTWWNGSSKNKNAMHRPGEVRS